jgi:hypothetical protein
MSGAAEAAETVRYADGKSDGPDSDSEASAGFVETGDGESGGGGRSRSRSSLKCERYNSLWFSGVPEGTENGQAAQAAEDSRTPLGNELKPGDSYGLVCTDETGQEVVNEMRVYNPSEPGILVDPEVLAEEARARLSVPAPAVEMSPKTGVNQIVQLPTWMWVTNWEADSATASVPGVTSTVTATPASVTWDMGNGDQVVCSGPGTPFDFSRPEEEQSADCSYTYRHSSTGEPGGMYQVSATMTYDVSWSASGAPGGGALPAVSGTATFPVRVLEIHAVEGVGSGGA